MNNIQAYLNQNYNEIRDECIKSKTLFIDEKFPANQTSLYRINSNRNENFKIENVTWKRPQEFLGSPCLVIDEIRSQDICQGQIGNCWFISALVSICHTSDYITDIVPLDNCTTYNDDLYCGIFHFRFWRFGYWIDVCIDDFLPVDENNHLVYCQNINNKNDLLFPLLEKAYAKLFTCYEFMIGGECVDAMIDLTGGIHQKCNIKSLRNNTKSKKLNEENEKIKLWNNFMKFYFSKSVCCASINSEKDEIKVGEMEQRLLLTAHSYSVIEIIEIFSANNDTYNILRTSIDEDFACYSSSIKLVKLKNPLGISYDGKFSVKSNEWKKVDQNVKDILNFSDQTDGQFFMSYDDEFYEMFDEAHFVYRNFDLMFNNPLTSMIFAENSCNWLNEIIYAEFVEGYNSGGSGKSNKHDFWKNPQFEMNLNIFNQQNQNSYVNVIITFMQMEQVIRRLKNNNEFKESNVPMTVSVFKVISKYAKLEKGKKYHSNELMRIYIDNNYIGQRQKTVQFSLEPANYLIIPSLFEKNVSLKFMLRIQIQKY